MLKADDLYAVDLIDPPNTDAVPVAPKGKVVLLIAVLLGAMTAMIVVFLLLRRHVSEAQMNGLNPIEIPFPNPFAVVAMMTSHFYWRLRDMITR